MFLFDPETNNFDNSEIGGRRKLPDPSMNNIFNVLWIGLQYTVSFKQLDFARNASLKQRQNLSP